MEIMEYGLDVWASITLVNNFTANVSAQVFAWI